MKAIYTFVAILFSVSLFAQEKDVAGELSTYHELSISQKKGKKIYGVLIVHGTDDKVVPLEYSTQAAKIYDNATLKVIDKAGHGFNPVERALSNGYVKDFLSVSTR